MWISKERYRALLKRIVALEQNHAVTFGVVNCMVDTATEFRPHQEGFYVHGRTVPINQLVCAIANHLGFKYKAPGKGGITPPPPPDPLAQRADTTKVKK